MTMQRKEKCAEKETAKIENEPKPQEATIQAKEDVATKEKAYDFLQQKDSSGANTVTIGVMQGDIRIYQLATTRRNQKNQQRQTVTIRFIGWLKAKKSHWSTKKEAQ